MKPNSGITPHLFISSFEVLIAYLINYLVFFKIRILEIITQIKYYEESLWVVGIMIITPVILGLMYIIFVLYKDSVLKLRYLIYSYLIILFAWIFIKGFVANILIEEYGTEHFFSNYYYYIGGSLAIYFFIYFMHKPIEDFIIYLKAAIEKKY